MSYIPTEWKTGDIVTAEKLNKLEEGVASGSGGGGGLLVKAEPYEEQELSGYKLTATYGEIKAAFDAGGNVQFVCAYNENTIFGLTLHQVYSYNGSYGVVLEDATEEIIGGGEMAFSANSDSDPLIYISST